MELTHISAFTAGVVTFLAPCVLPIVPAYLSFITGVGADEPGTQVKVQPFKSLIPVLFFIGGFSLVFIIMGATATALGRLFADSQQVISRIGGATVIFFGLHFTNLFLRDDFLKIFSGAGFLFVTAFCFELMEKETFLMIAGAWAFITALYLFQAHLLLYRQLKAQRNTGASIFSAFIIGLTFGAGWSPCIGPVLGAILLLASRQETVYQGMIFLALFSAGLGIPFFIAGLFWTSFIGFVRKFGKFFAVVEFIGGVLLLTMGLLLLTGKLSLISSW
ncbi:cytochrome c biogenesis CcdA family protein [Candidatus Magnetominusculus dajiuhuensis]|uniref:cytochrome c biogenesis CcdA family protein n=1 Tax=Candidatus Magnetominusculus dajiuhuensis TaxID=3137712 RepID=UPI003B437115